MSWRSTTGIMSFLKSASLTSTIEQLRWLFDRTAFPRRFNGFGCVKEVVRPLDKLKSIRLPYAKEMSTHRIHVLSKVSAH